MQARDSVTIAYSAEPEVLTISILKSSAKNVLQALVDLGAVNIRKAKVAEQDVYEKVSKSYYEDLLELNGSIKDDSFAEQNDFSLESNLSRDFL